MVFEVGGGLRAARSVIDAPLLGIRQDLASFFVHKDANLQSNKPRKLCLAQ